MEQFNKIINPKVINIEFEKYEKESFYKRIHLLMREFNYKSVFAFCGNKLIYYLIDRKALLNFKTWFTLEYICRVNGKMLNMNWMYYGDRFRPFIGNDIHNGTIFFIILCYHRV